MRVKALDRETEVLSDVGSKGGKTQPWRGNDKALESLMLSFRSWGGSGQEEPSWSSLTGLE